MSLPIEILGHIGSYLYNHDHYRLSLCCKYLWENLPTYSNNLILTESQEDLAVAIRSKISETNLMRIYSFPHTGMKIALCSFLISYLKERKRNVLIVCKTYEVEKWKIILQKYFTEEDRDYCTLVYIAYQGMCDKYDLIISSSSQSIIHGNIPLINCFSYLDQDEDLLFGPKSLIKKCIIPLPSYKQALFTSSDLLQALQMIMMKHDSITLIVKHSYPDTLKTILEKTYHVVEYGKESSQKKGTIILLDADKRLGEYSISGVVVSMVYNAYYDVDPKMKSQLLIHKGLLFSPNVKKIYWFYRESGKTHRRRMRAAYRILSNSLAYFSNTRNETNERRILHQNLNEIPSDSDLYTLFKRKKSYITWRMNDSLKSLCSMKDMGNNSIIQSFLQNERRYY